jgi:alkaline phosphatase
MFLAVLRFNQAIGRFMEYAFYNPDTFVLITADHETGGLHPGAGGNYVYSSGDHSGANVPVFVYGQGAEIFDGQTVENTELPITIAKTFWGEESFGDPKYEALS